jgi:hypothetical protein
MSEPAGALLAMSDERASALLALSDKRASALLALWNDVDPALDAEYNEWHANEHVPERLTVPGILWGLRYGRVGESAAMPRYLTLYGLRDAGVLDSEPYQRLLREPTPMSRSMRPALMDLSRWVCALLTCDGLDRGSHLAVQTSDAEPAAADLAAYRLRADNTAILGHLTAERIAQAATLPWLQSGQGQAIEGRTLVCLAGDGDVFSRMPGLSQGPLFKRLVVSQ